MSTKIEIKLKKCEPLQWKALNITPEELAKRSKVVEKKRKFQEISTIDLIQVINLMVFI